MSSFALSLFAELFFHTNFWQMGYGKSCCKQSVERMGTALRDQSLDVPVGRVEYIVDGHKCR